MKKIITTIAFSFLALISFSQVSNNTVMVRVVETWNDVNNVSAGVMISINAEILISYPSGEIEQIDLKDKGHYNHSSNTEVIHKTLDQFFSDQYELLSEQSTGGTLWSTQTWIFREVETE